ncbi:DUF397 domain-containing protein [Pseudonocardia sp. CA-107938]|uniref:DUF397 domain-containing protein n=1 Tax=Pseudonocardia sp. CA-107938 TaxID=3240021 RepID=UPI003D89D5F5
MHSAAEVERLAWRTSSFSGGGQNGSGCVEVAPLWRTSSFSGGGQNGDSCVEVAPVPAGIAVRDTKDRTRTPHVYSGAAWSALLAGVRAGDLDA